jgi:phenylacetate-CoA ligase
MNLPINFYPEIEKKPLNEIKEYQEALLQQQIGYIAKHSPYYQRVFDTCKIKPGEIKTLEDLSKLPFTTKP